MSTVDELLAQLRKAADPHAWAKSHIDAIAALNGDASHVWAELVKAGVKAADVVQLQQVAVRRHTGDEPPQSVKMLKALTDLGYRFEWNVLDDSIEVNGARMDDGMAAQIRTQMRDLGFKGVQTIEDAYTAHAYQNRYHPIQRYLDGLIWDGENHVMRLAACLEDTHEPIVYTGKGGDVTAAPVARVWLYRWLLAAVARACQPAAGIQNRMLVFDGPQGIGKSHLAAWLASPLREYFIESPIHPDNKEHDRYLATKWLWEVAELGATTRRADREALKSFITRGDVTFRKPYARHAVTKPALSSFIGTINNEAGFLTDPTGNRRFMVVTLKHIDWRYADEIDPSQLWAQMAHLYRSGERWELAPAEAATRDALNRGYEREDPYEALVLKHLEVDPAQTDWFMFTTDIADTLKAYVRDGNEQAIYNNIAAALRRLGLESTRRRMGDKQARGYAGIRLKGAG